MTDIINILCATDDKYVPYCGIMLTSLFESNKLSKFRVFILTEQLSEKNVCDFHLLAKDYGQKIQIITVDSEALRNCPIRKKTT